MRKDIEFRAGDGTVLRGWFYEAQNTSAPAPIVVMAHGYSGVKGSLTKYADLFSAAGLAVMLYDHRGFGSSDGAVRQEIDPHQQVADMRDAITFAQTLPGIDPDRLGVWGSSFAGGHAITLGANDHRVKCVVAQVPMISGHETVRRMFLANRAAKLDKMFTEDRIARMKGSEPKRIPVFSTEDEVCSLPPQVSARFIKASEDEDPLWKNEVTLRSLELMGEYEPGAIIHLVDVAPILMIVGLRDTVTPADVALEAYNRALEPKKLLTYPGGHFAAYYQFFDQTSVAARDWFVQHLAADAGQASVSGKAA
jgi:cephalosporin-C deacetylase-like acetyl esterase